jgi:hypothetical protein
LLDQRLSIVPQHQWISKLFGFDFTVEYRLGHLNTVADALSRRDVEDGMAVSAPGAPGAAMVVFGPTFFLLEDIQHATSLAPDGQRLQQQLQAGEIGEPWRLDHGLLLHGSRVYMLDHGDLRH